MVDYNEPAQKVRLLIGDTNADDPDFTDEQIEGFLTIARNSVLRAAADALDAIATDEALISKKLRTQDRQSDGPSVADALRKHANALRARAKEEEDAEDDEPFFMAFNLDGPGSQEGEEMRL